MEPAATLIRGDPWTREEVEATVADYLAMLTLELSGQAYSKTEHRRNLAPKLDGRTDSAIERKHQNISAILIELGYPAVGGYKPLPNCDYLERESRNRSLGAAGEAFVVKLERWRLESAGQGRLAAKIVHVSKELGDGPGFDVLSFHPDGKERYIEVKTTSFSRDTPFFVTQRELEVSVHSSDKYALYRVFEFRRNPRLFE